MDLGWERRVRSIQPTSGKHTSGNRGNSVGGGGAHHVGVVGIGFLEVSPAEAGRIGQVGKS